MEDKSSDRYTGMLQQSEVQTVKQQHPWLNIHGLLLGLKALRTTVHSTYQANNTKETEERLTWLTLYNHQKLSADQIFACLPDFQRVTEVSF